MAKVKKNPTRTYVALEAENLIIEQLLKSQETVKIPKKGTVSAADLRATILNIENTNETATGSSKTTSAGTVKKLFHGEINTDSTDQYFELTKDSLTKINFGQYCGYLFEVLFYTTYVNMLKHSKSPKQSNLDERNAIMQKALLVKQYEAREILKNNVKPKDFKDLRATLKYLSLDIIKKIEKKSNQNGQSLSGTPFFSIDPSAPDDIVIYFNTFSISLDLKSYFVPPSGNVWINYGTLLDEKLFPGNLFLDFLKLKADKGEIFWWTNSDYHRHSKWRSYIKRKPSLFSQYLAEAIGNETIKNNKDLSTLLIYLASKGQGTDFIDKQNYLKSKHLLINARTKEQNGNGYQMELTFDISTLIEDAAANYKMKMKSTNSPQLFKKDKYLLISGKPTKEEKEKPLVAINFDFNEPKKAEDKKRQYFESTYIAIKMHTNFLQTNFYNQNN